MTLCFDQAPGYGKRSHLALGMRAVIAGACNWAELSWTAFACPNQLKIIVTVAANIVSVLAS